LFKQIIALIMISTILPIVALAGAAMAACPLSVEISSTDAHVAQVAVTNTGADAVTVFKGNTVFSEHDTKDLLVSDAGKLPIHPVALPLNANFVLHSGSPSLLVFTRIMTNDEHR
jgi:hypothetical protein